MRVIVLKSDPFRTTGVSGIESYTWVISVYKPPVFTEDIIVAYRSGFGQV